MDPGHATRVHRDRRDRELGRPRRHRREHEPHRAQPASAAVQDRADERAEPAAVAAEQNEDEDRPDRQMRVQIDADRHARGESDGRIDRVPPDVAGRRAVTSGPASALRPSVPSGGAGGRSISRGRRRQGQQTPQAVAPSRGARRRPRDRHQRRESSRRLDQARPPTSASSAASRSSE